MGNRSPRFFFLKVENRFRIKTNGVKSDDGKIKINFFNRMTKKNLDIITAHSSINL